MCNILNVIIGILLPFIGTALGAAAVFFIVKTGDLATRLLLGFASGVMLATSVWSLLIPAIETSDGWVPAVVGFLLGATFISVIDKIMPWINKKRLSASGVSKQTMMILAVTLHNLPEGMAVGVVYAGLLSGEGITAGEAFALSVGIALQNLPEGAVISAPLAASGVKRKKAFGYGVLSGAVEPVGAIVTLLLTATVVPILPYVLAFAAGTMIYVTAGELIPEATSAGRAGAMAVTGGFALMMLLDII